MNLVTNGKYTTGSEEEYLEGHDSTERKAYEIPINIF